MKPEAKDALQLIRDHGHNRAWEIAINRAAMAPKDSNERDHWLLVLGWMGDPPDDN